MRMDYACQTALQTEQSPPPKAEGATAHAVAPLRAENVLLSWNEFVQPPPCYFTPAAKAVEVWFPLRHG